MYTTDIRSIFIILIRLCSLFGLSVGDEKCTEFNKNRPALSRIHNRQVSFKTALF